MLGGRVIAAPFFFQVPLSPADGLRPAGFASGGKAGQVSRSLILFRSSRSHPPPSPRRPRGIELRRVDPLDRKLPKPSSGRC